MRKYAFLVSLIVCVIILFLFSFYFSTQITKPYAGPIDKIVVGESVLVQIAKNKGFFLKNGLDVEVRDYVSGPLAVEDLLAGNSQFVVAAEFVGVTNFFTTQNLRIIAQIAARDAFRMIIRKDKDILTPADLKGKTIGVTKKSAGEFFLSRFLILNNIALKEVKLVDLPASQMSEQLKSGTIDAVVTIDPTAYTLQKSLGDQAIVWSVQADQKSLGVAYATDAYIRANPDIVKRFLKALVETEAYVKANNSQARDLVAQQYGYDTAYMNYYWPSFDFTVSLNQALLIGMEDQAQWMIENKFTSATEVPNYLDFIFFEGLESVKPEAVTIIH